MSTCGGSQGGRTRVYGLVDAREAADVARLHLTEDVAGKTKGRHHVGGVLVVVLELPELRHLRKTLQNR